MHGPSLVHTYPSSPSIIERQAIIDKDNDNIDSDVENNQINNNEIEINEINNNENEINQPINVDVVQEQEQQPQEKQQQ